jgi:hypothetical protein
MLNPTTHGHRGPDNTTMQGSINERIREVLLFIKTCGCTSVSCYVVAMCDSGTHDIKHLTGIMLGSRGVFTELEESLGAVDNTHQKNVF